ncbi:MAG: hypothetical protein ABJ327_17500 [Litoreibacter sp.]
MVDTMRGAVLAIMHGNQKVTTMRPSLTSASILAVFLLQSAAIAQVSVADGVVAQLQTNGYTVTEVRRSWLGRIVITAKSGEGLREIVLNRTSGEILRDQTFPNESGPKDGPANPTGNLGDNLRPQLPGESNGRGGQPGPHGPEPSGGGHGGKR